jgi:hypothetical protein
MRNKMSNVFFQLDIRSKLLILVYKEYAQDLIFSCQRFDQRFQ